MKGKGNVKQRQESYKEMRISDIILSLLKKPVCKNTVLRDQQQQN